MAATNKCLAESNKSRRGSETTKKRETGWISDAPPIEYVR
jgi:hypothetical protein